MEYSSAKMHAMRIRQELRAAGVNIYGLSKFSLRYLPSLIEYDEHIKACIYGRYSEKNGPKLNAGVLVATDKRLIFLDHKPGFTRDEEVSYKEVNGIKHTSAIFSSITVVSRMKDYSLRFVNSKSAAKFVKYVDSRIIEPGRPAEKS